MDIDVFYHIWGSENLPHTTLLVYEQVKKIIKSKLYKNSKLWCFVSGHHTTEICDFLRQFDFIHDVIYQTDPGEVVYEDFTLHHLRSHAIQNPSHKFLYFHTKGSESNLLEMSSDTRMTNYHWRSVMEYVCIDEWKERAKELQLYDTVGCRYGIGPEPHYSGNFWWANGEYLKTLPDIYDYHHKVGDRIKCEMWLCSNNPNFLSVHETIREITDFNNIYKI